MSVDSSGGFANANSEFGDVSGDGRVFALVSWASNLIANDTNGCVDVFVHDRITGTTERVSVDSSGGESNMDSSFPSLSSDGRYVAFMSYCETLVPHDKNGWADIFVHDRTTGSTRIMSIDSNGASSNGPSFYPPSISDDGDFVALVSHGSNLVAGDTNGVSDVFVRVRKTGAIERVSVDSAGAEQNGSSYACALSGDGLVVAFESEATNLVAGDANALQDVFVHDRTTGITERVSVTTSGQEADGASWFPVLSADGRFVAFWSDATNLVPGDTNGQHDVFVHDRVTGTTECVSVDPSGGPGNSYSLGPAISSDGRFVTFWGDASNLVPSDGNGDSDVFVRDRTTGVTTLASLTSAGKQVSGGSDSPSISADGQVVGFVSISTDYDPGDKGFWSDVFAHVALDATWTNYGSGVAGTNGVPGFTSEVPPRIGETVTLDLGNSSGAASYALLFVGFQRATIPTAWGGDLLVLPFITVPLSVPAAGMTLTGDLPDDSGLIGLALDLQTIESDVGAVDGVSFTPGLELILGH